MHNLTIWYSLETIACHPLDHALMTYMLNLTHKTNECKMILTWKALVPIVSANGKLASLKELQYYQKSKTYECKKCNKIILYWLYKEKENDF